MLRKRILVFVALVTLFVVAHAPVAIADDPPPLPLVELPLRVPPISTPAPLPGDSGFAITRADLARSSISPWLVRVMLEHRFGVKSATAPIITQMTPTQPDTPVMMSKTVLLRPHSTVDVLTPATPVCPSLDYKQEPVILANWYTAYPGNISPGYDERAIAAYMKFPNFSYWNRPWLYLTRVGPAAPCGEIRLPAGNPPPPDQAGWYTSGDPVVAVNPYNTERRSGTTGGVKPGRMYVAGTTYNPNYTQISVWHSDDGGLTGWNTLPSVLGNNGAPIQTADWVLDKPSITVSYDAGSTSPSGRQRSGGCT